MSDSLGDIILYETPGGETRLEVRLEHDTVWLRQEQMGQLFGRERSVITKHLRNLFAEGELDAESNVQNLHIAGSDKPVRFWNLDATGYPSVEAKVAHLPYLSPKHRVKFSCGLAGQHHPFWGTARITCRGSVGGRRPMSGMKWTEP